MHPVHSLFLLLMDWRVFLIIGYWVVWSFSCVWISQGYTLRAGPTPLLGSEQVHPYGKIANASHSGPGNIKSPWQWVSSPIGLHLGNPWHCALVLAILEVHIACCWDLSYSWSWEVELWATTQIYRSLFPNELIVVFCFVWTQTNLELLPSSSLLSAGVTSRHNHT